MGLNHAELVSDGCERDTGTDRRGRDDVMPTRVAHLRQRVVLGHDCDVQRSWAIRAHERCLEICHVALDFESGFLEPFDEPPARHRLFEIEFGIGLNPMRQADQCLMRTLDALAGSFPEFADGGDNVCHDVDGRGARIRTWDRTDISRLL